MPLREPSRRVRNTRKFATPRLESGAPSGLASTTNTWPSQFDANHLKPLSSQASPSRCRVSRRLQRAEVGAARALGQQLSGLALPLARRELGKDMLAHVGRRVGGDQRLDHAAAGSKRAPHSDVGLVEQIVGREQRQRRVDAGPPRIVFQCLLRVQDRPFWTR